MVLGAVEAGSLIVLHGGGLWERSTLLDLEKRNYIRKSDERIAALTGRTFGKAYLDGLLSDPEATWWSRPTIAAVLAAESLLPGAGLPMIGAIQQAHYVEGRKVVDEDVLLEAAGTLGLSMQSFRQAFHSVAVDDHIERTRALMRQWGLSGFPSFLVEQDGAFRPLSHEIYYGQPAAFVDAIGADPAMATVR